MGQKEKTKSDVMDRKHLVEAIYRASISDPKSGPCCRFCIEDFLEALAGGAGRPALKGLSVFDATAVYRLISGRKGGSGCTTLYDVQDICRVLLSDDKLAKAVSDVAGFVKD